MKYSWHICIALTVAALVLGCASTSNEPTKIDEPAEQVYVETGNDLLIQAERSWDSEQQAVQFYKQASDTNPNNAYAAFKYGEGLMRFDEMDRARDALLQAVEIDPGFGFAHSTLGQIARHFGELELAEDHANWAIEANPDLAEPRLLRASIRAETGRDDEASADFYFVIEHGVGWERGQAYHELGYLRLRNERPEEALEAFMQSIEIAPEDTSGYISAAETLLKLGNAERAIELLDKAARETWDPHWARITSSRFHIEFGDFKRALELANGVLDEEPNRIDALPVRGQAHLGLGMFEEAATDFERYLEQEDWDSWIHGEYGRALLRLERIDEAEREFDIALERWWEDINARAGKAEILERRGDLDGAWNEINIGLEFAGLDRYLLVRGAIVLARLGNQAKIDELIDRMQNEDASRLEEDQLTRLREYFAANPESLKVLEKISDRLPSDLAKKL